MLKLESLVKQPVLWLLLLCAANLFAFLGGHTLWDVDEPNNAVCAREMLLAGNWWVPMFNGDYRFDKPILIYWLMMPMDALFGFNEWSARLPSALSMTALVIVIWAMTRRLMESIAPDQKERTALMAAGVFATALHVLVIGRASVPDPLLMLCLGITLPALLISWLEQDKQPGKTMPAILIIAYVAIGFGVLAKGPIAGLMPLLIIALFLTLIKGWSSWRTFHPWKGVLIASAVALPWYVTVGILTDGVWLEGFLFHHNLDRFTDPLQGHKGFPGLYLISVLLGWFPWSGLLVAALVFGCWRLPALRQQPVRLFLLCWIAMYILFFSIASTKLPNYVLPLFPAAAMLMAYSWAHFSSAQKQSAIRWVLWAALIVALALVVGGGLALEKKWPGDGFYTLAMLPVVLVCGWYLWRKRQDIWLPVAIAMSCSILILTGWSLPAMDRHKISKTVAATASESGFDGNSLATFHYFQPSLLFYHGGRLPDLTNVEAVGEWLVDGKAVVIPQQSLELLPKEIIPYLIVHDRVYGMYARRWLLLVSLQPLNGGIDRERELKWPKH